MSGQVCAPPPSIHLIFSNTLPCVYRADAAQGPYYGQAVWFQKCPEAIPVAKERYIEQIARVFGVLDGILAGREYLLGGEATYADLAFVPWDIVALNAPFFREPLIEVYKVEERYPNFLAWHRRLASRPAVVRAYASDSA
jgi:glutathione S-transferase